MDEQTLRTLLESVRAGDDTVDDAVTKLRNLPFESLEFANIDHHRGIRCGFPEVVFCPGKKTAQIVEITGRLVAGGGNVLLTRAKRCVFEAVQKVHESAEYSDAARTVVIRQRPPVESAGFVGIACAGTSDLPVAEEARVTCEVMDQRTRTFYDVGVAGIHRLLAHSEALQSASVLVVVAGMEGALASVVGGLVAVPVIAVPTSIGYGASFGGVAPLLTMLNSCAAGVSVVNIDNGFGAGYIASLINRVALPQSECTESK
jgi:hypothetical protein